MDNFTVLTIMVMQVSLVCYCLMTMLIKCTNVAVDFLNRMALLLKT